MSDYPMGPNGYKCKTCGQVTMTEHADDGVTPMFLGCRETEGCTGQAVSMMYPAAPIPEPLASQRYWEWYRPTEGATRELSPSERSHIAQGGLMLRGPIER